MKNRGLLISIWIGATAVMMAVTYSAINLIGSQVTERPIAASTTIVEDGTVVSTTSTDPAGKATSTSSADSNSTTIENSTASTSSTNSTDSTTSTSAGSSTSTTSPASSTSTTSTTSSSSTSTTISETTSTTEPDDDGNEVATGPFVISSPGGVVTVSCLGDTVSFGGATPSAGFSMIIDSNGPERVRVEFESADDEYRVEATCNDGVMTPKVDQG